MKLLIFSDVHRQKNKLLKILQTHADADLVISLGDTELKASFLQTHDIIAIKGNYPFDPGQTYEHTMTIKNKRLFFTHGHKYSVRSGIDQLFEKTKSLEVDFIFYGHTHVAAYMHVETVHIINPGAVGKSRSETPESYLIALLKDEYTIMSWYDAQTHALLKELRI